MNPRQGTAVALATLPLALAGCGGGDSAEKQPAPKTATVDIREFKYAPETIRVAAGGTVTFVNRDRASHTSTAKGGFDTGRIEKDASKPVRVGDTGRVEYICAFHPYMKGVVEVEDG